MERLQRPRPSEAHVWQVCVGSSSGLPGGWTRALSAGELARAGRFRSPVDRLRYLDSRWWLRSVIGAYLGVDARLIEFGISARGKPWLASPAVGWLHFNISHSQDRLAVAVANSCEVGVDVEMVPDDPREIRDAISVLKPAELEALAGCATEQQRALRFYQLWTRREAVLKASGVGLGKPVREDFAAAMAGTPRAPSNARFADPGETVSVAQLELGPGFVGAVAANVNGAQLPTCASTLNPENLLITG